MRHQRKTFSPENGTSSGVYALIMTLFLLPLSLRFIKEYRLIVRAENAHSRLFCVRAQECK